MHVRRAHGRESEALDVGFDERVVNPVDEGQAGVLREDHRFSLMIEGEAARGVGLGAGLLEQLVY